MRGELLAGLGVEPAFVGMQVRLRSTLRTRTSRTFGCGGVLDMEHADFAATLDQRDDCALVAGLLRACRGGLCAA